MRSGQNIFVKFMEKEPSTKFYGILIIFQKSYEVPKLNRIRR